MDRVSPTSATTPTSSSAVQLRRLCRHILGVQTSDEVLSEKFRCALQLLSRSASGQIDPNYDAFIIVKKIKKFLVQDGREREVNSFEDIWMKLQNSCVLKNPLAILYLMYNLSERSNRATIRIVPPFSYKYDDIMAKLGPSDKAPSYIARVVPVPFRHRPSSLIITSSNENTALPTAGPITPATYHPPLPPKPNLLIKPSKEPASTPEVDAAEHEVLRELLYSFQGVGGVIIKKSLAPKAESGETSFVFADPYRDKFPSSFMHLALRLAELGHMFNIIHTFCEGKLAERDIGLISQSFVTALKAELSDYYCLLAKLETQVVRVDKISDCSPRQATLIQLSYLTLEPFYRLQLLSSIVGNCGRLRGGALITGLFGFLHHGDAKMAAIVQKLLTTVSKPLYTMILRWILDGTLDDPFEEFFIASDTRDDEARVWQDKYSIRRSMIPKFLGLSWVKKILVTGKSINFLHSVCHNNEPIPGKDAISRMLDEQSGPANLFLCEGGNGNCSKLHDAIDRCYRATSSLLLDVFFKQYKFIDHVTAIRKYLLLGQGDLIRYLLELLDEELCQPATRLYPYNLAGILETAIRATNTQYEDPDILERLEVRLLDIQLGDSGWDVFSLDYKVQGPIGTVFGKNIMTNYLMLFNSLWRAKRMEWIMSCVWTRQTGLHKMMLRSLPELKPVLHIANLLSSEMVHFIHQLAYYTAFEVMECSWDVLVRRLKQAENLDEVIEAHNEFQHNLLRRALLDDRSSDILTQLRAIYDRILEFSNIQNKLYVMSVAESEARAAYQLAIVSRGQKNQYGLTQADEDKETARRVEYSNKTLPHIETQLKIVCQCYQDMVRTFLLQLTCSQDKSLQFLSFRLDFNEHYKRKDSRLGTSLTLQHKRASFPE